MLALPERLAERYRVGAAIGHGAIAEVVRAVDETTGREVALKLLYPALRENPVVVERFRREVELVRRIRHSHVLAIHEVVDSDGWLFLVMDYHPGGDLADRLAREPSGRLPPAEVRVLAAQLGGALAAAHRAGIVHRDVKPSNVLAGGGDNARGLDVRLCDFGLARSAEGSGLTTSTAVLGTPEYMAPEVIAEGHADQRSDLYSLGVVLFEAATGRLPFVADSPYQLMRQHLQETPPRPRDLVPDLPAEIDEAIFKALAKDPLDRFASAAEMAEAFTVSATSAAVDKADVSLALSRRGAPCPACGGWLVESAALCADCGHQLLRLEPEAGGVSILVTGPGSAGDKLDAKKHVALYRLLGELPAAGGAPLERQARAPRFPFYVARGLSQSSAQSLLERVQALGLSARIHKGWALRPKEMRKKVNTMSWRIFAGMGAAAWGGQVHNLLPDSVPAALRFSLMPLMLLGLPALFAVELARRSSKPLVRPAVDGRDTVVLSPVIAWLRRLSSRQDRRLLARICERLGRTPLDPASLAGLVARATDLAAALHALEQADAASSEAAPGGDPSQAQSELRRLERGRVLLRAELLRLSSHLEAAAGATVLAGAEAGAREARSAAQVADELAVDLDAQRELEMFLAGGRHGQEATVRGPATGPASTAAGAS